MKINEMCKDIQCVKLNVHEFKTNQIQPVKFSFINSKYNIANI